MAKKKVEQPAARDIRTARDTMAPNELHGACLRGQDQKAAQAKIELAKIRETQRHNFGMGAVPYDWHHEEELHRQVHRANRKGMPGGATFTREDIKG